MKRRFVQCDVFSGVALKGNGLAVVLDGAGLSEAQMQAFAAWAQQAETTFLMPPRSEQANYAVRIFAATGELPFAGHPFGKHPEDDNRKPDGDGRADARAKKKDAHIEGDEQVWSAVWTEEPQGIRDETDRDQAGGHALHPERHASEDSEDRPAFRQLIVGRVGPIVWESRHDGRVNQPGSLKQSSATVDHSDNAYDGAKYDHTQMGLI